MVFKIKKFNEFLNEKWVGDAINIFDVDDTLVVTPAKIHVYDPIKKKEYVLTPAEYNTFKIKKHYKLDYGDFNDIKILRKGILVDWVINILKRTIEYNKAVGIITARSDANMIRTFFLEHGIDINPNFIFAVGSYSSGSIAERKKKAFESFIKMGFRRFQYFDDDEKNIEFIKSLENEFDNITIKTKLIKHKWLPELKKEYI